MQNVYLQNRWTQSASTFHTRSYFKYFVINQKHAVSFSLH